MYSKHCSPSILYSYESFQTLQILLFSLKSTSNDLFFNSTKNSRLKFIEFHPGELIACWIFEFYRGRLGFHGWGRRDARLRPDSAARRDFRSIAETPLRKFNSEKSQPAPHNVVCSYSTCFTRLF